MPYIHQHVITFHPFKDTPNTARAEWRLHHSKPLSVVVAPLWVHSDHVWRCNNRFQPSTTCLVWIEPDAVSHLLVGEAPLTFSSLRVPHLDVLIIATADELGTIVVEGDVLHCLAMAWWGWGEGGVSVTTYSGVSSCACVWMSVQWDLSIPDTFGAVWDRPKCPD